MKKIFAILLIMALSIGLLAGCTADQTAAPTAPAGGGTPAATATAGEPIVIGAITSLSGALQDYGEQFRRGFYLGLEYMTDGTMEVAGRPLQTDWEDTTNVPDVARERTLALLERGVDIVTGYAASGDAVASLALFEEFDTVAVIEPAAADAIISAPNWNEYVFRTGRTSGQDALAMLSVLNGRYPQGGEGVTIATFGPDTTFGFSMVEPFVAHAEAAGFDIVATEFAPHTATDFSPFLLRIRALAPDYLYMIWAGENSPYMQLMELDLQAVGTTIITGAPELAQLVAMRPLGEMGGIGFCIYYSTLPQNVAMNDWLVEQHWERYNMPPDIFTSGGMAAASAIVTALELTGGVTDSAVLKETMRGMEFMTPTGNRYFRPEDGQAMQVLFEIEFTAEEGVDHMIPRWVRTIPAEEIAPPIMNR